jgi:hypothetical protein
MTFSGPPIDLRPGSRPAPEPKYEPSDHETTLAVLEGHQAPKVCPYCGRPWSAAARCVCQEPEPYVSPWVRAWRWLVALVTPAPPRVVYSDELPRPQPPPRPPKPHARRAEPRRESTFEREWRNVHWTERGPLDTFEREWGNGASPDNDHPAE